MQETYVIWVVAGWLRMSSPNSPFTVNPSRYVDEYPKSSPEPTSDSVTMSTTGYRTRDELRNSRSEVWKRWRACAINVDDPIVLGRSWIKIIWCAADSKDVYRCEFCRNVENFLDNDWISTYQQDVGDVKTNFLRGQFEFVDRIDPFNDLCAMTFC